MTESADWRRRVGRRFSEPLVRLLAHTPLTPNIITGLGFVLSAGAAALIINRHFLEAGILMLVAGLFDMLDGALARRTNRVSRFGAVLDSTLDRLSEGVILLGLLYFFAQKGSPVGAVLAGATLLLSLLVSYIRSRAEGIGLTCSEGWFTRTERVIVLTLGLMLNQPDTVLAALLIIAALSLLTAAQRLVVIWQKTRDSQS